MAGLTLDTVVSSALFFAGKWEATLKRNQSRDVLRALLSKLYGASHGALFHARIRCSHAALADACGLSREWVCKLVARLRAAGWVETYAPRLANGKQQEVTVFRAGAMLKRLLVMLLKSKQRFGKARVNDTSQLIPTKEEVAKNKALLADLLASLSQKLGPPGGQRGR